MPEYDNNLRGVLFSAKDKKTSENSPDYKGQCEIYGEEYWLSAWIKTGAKGKFMSLSFTAKEQPKNPPASTPAKQSRSQQRDDFGDSVPF